MYIYNKRYGYAYIDYLILRGMFIQKIMLNEKYDAVGRRFYFDPSAPIPAYYPSVTTLLSVKSPFQSHGPNNATKMGEIVHYHILKNYTDDTLIYPDVRLWGMSDDEMNTKIDNAMKMWSMLDLNMDDTLGVEMVCKNNNPKYAGRIDWLGIWDFDESCEWYSARSKCQDGLKTIMDLKTGNYYSYYKYQLAAYMNMTDAEQGILAMIDINEKRNPDLLPKLRVFSKEQLAPYLVEFHDLARTF